MIGQPEVRDYARSESALESGRLAGRECESVGVEAEFDLSELPPLPRPAYFEMAMQSACGSTLVFALIAVFVGTTHFVPLADDVLPPFLWWVCFIAIHAEAVVALICLAGLLFGNPGVIRRSPATCLPMPSEVVDRIKRNMSMDGLPNIIEGGSTFCVRCFVWRPPGSVSAHHCSTCQRCVVEFDHHCGVFGRCIAGPQPWHRPFRGNMTYFVTIIVMGYGGAMTCFGFTVLALFWKHVDF